MYWRVILANLFCAEELFAVIWHFKSRTSFKSFPRRRPPIIATKVSHAIDSARSFDSTRDQFDSTREQSDSTRDQFDSTREQFDPTVTRWALIARGGNRISRFFPQWRIMFRVSRMAALRLNIKRIFEWWVNLWLCSQKHNKNGLSHQPLSSASLTMLSTQVTEQWLERCPSDDRSECKYPNDLQALSALTGLTYPQWREDVAEAQDIFITTPQLIVEFLEIIRKRQNLHDGNRSAKSLRALDKVIAEGLQYDWWMRDIAQVIVELYKYHLFTNEWWWSCSDSLIVDPNPNTTPSYWHHPLTGRALLCEVSESLWSTIRDHQEEIVAIHWRPLCKWVASFKLLKSQV